MNSAPKPSPTIATRTFPAIGYSRQIVSKRIKSPRRNATAWSVKRSFRIATKRPFNKKRRFRVKWLYAEPAGNPKLTARKDSLTLRRFFKGNALSLAAAGQQAQRAQAQQREAGGLGGRDREPQGVARRAGVLIGAAGVA